MRNTIPLIALSLLILTCISLSILDNVRYKIQWSTFAIYVPCFLVFSFGFYAWKKRSSLYLLWFSILLGAILLCLLGYDVYSWTQSDYQWAAVTLLFIALLGALAAGSFYTSMKVKHSSEETPLSNLE